MDLIADYPERAMAYIGLFMMEASVQQAGIGTRIVEDLCRHLAEEGIRTVRLCWVKGNPQAEHFWRKISLRRSEKHRACRDKRWFWQNGG